MIINSRRFGKGMWQKEMVEFALNTGKRVLCIDRNRTTIKKRKGHLTLIKNALVKKPEPIIIYDEFV